MKRTDPSLRGIKTFVAVAECGGVARAAEILGYSQPAVTLQIQQLEERIGAKLFERRQRQLHLTAAGRQALEPARHLLNSIAAFENAARQPEVEEIKPLLVGAIEPAASDKLPSILSKMHRVMPGLPIRLDISGGDRIALAAERGTIDVALTVPTKLPGWVYEPLFNERFVLLVPSNHRLARRSSVSLSQLTNEHFIVTDDTCVYRRAIERAFLRYGVKGRRVVESTSLASLPGSVAAGLGVALVPKPASAQQPPGVHVVSIRECLEMTIGLLRPKTFDDSSAVGHFIISAYDLRRRSS